MDNSICALSAYHTTEQIKDSLKESLPPIFTRKKAAELTGNFITAKTMANLDAINRGPARKVMIGRQIGYFKEDFIDFFINYVKR